MKLCIVGGGLYGMEAAYLATKAGYDVSVMDRDPEAPAASLTGNAIINVDPVSEPDLAAKALSDFDLVLPVSSNVDLVMALESMAGDRLLLSPDAYLISSSRTAFHVMLQSLGVPIPREWPECGFPAVMKPSDNSRKGETRIVRSSEEAEKALYDTRLDEGAFVIQEYVEGKTLSLEVMGDGSEYRTFEISKSEFDDRYDCKRVVCSPDRNESDDRQQLRDIACDIARSLSLEGLMGVEAILGPMGPVVIDVNERIPCRSPSAVLHSTGVNYLEEAVWISTYGSMRGHRPSSRRTAICEHILVEGKRATVCGKHRLGRIGELRIEKGLFGFDEVVTDYAPGSDRWMMTAMVSGNGRNDTSVRRDNCIARMMEECGISTIDDPEPPDRDQRGPKRL